MKKLVTALFALVLFAGTSSAQSLLKETFAYPVGNLVGQGGWTAHNAGGTTPIQVSATSLSFTGYTSTGGQSAVLGTAGGEDANTPFTGQTAGSVYASFMVNFSSVTTTTGYFAHFFQTTNTFYARLYAKSDGAGGVNLGISKAGNAGTEVYSPTSYGLNTTYLVVIKYTFNTGSTTDDQVSLFVFAPGDTIPSVEPAPTATTTGTATDATNIAGFALRQGGSTSSPGVTIGGIRAATTWNEAPLPVQLAAFTAETQNGNITLNWETASEINSDVFEVQELVAGNWTTVRTVSAKGSTTEAASYTEVFSGLRVGTHTFRLKKVDKDGQVHFSNAISVTVEVPGTFVMNPAYPNPFNPQSTVTFAVAAKQNVTMNLYNVLGQHVATLYNGTVEANTLQTVRINGAELKSGTYLVRLIGENFSSTQRVTLLK